MGPPIGVSLMLYICIVALIVALASRRYLDKHAIQVHIVYTGPDDDPLGDIPDEGLE